MTDYERLPDENGELTLEELLQLQGVFGNFIKRLYNRHVDIALAQVPFNKDERDFSLRQKEVLNKISALCLEAVQNISHTLRREGVHTGSPESHRISIDKHKRKHPNADRSVLYDAIISPIRDPQKDFDDESTQLEVNIISDNTIVINDTEFILAGHQLFMLNALISLRDQGPVKADQIRGLGFQTGSMPIKAFGRVIKRLMERFEGAARINIIEQTTESRWKLYELNHAIKFIDKRTKKPQDDNVPNSLQNPDTPLREIEPVSSHNGEDTGQGNQGVETTVSSKLLPVPSRELYERLLTAHYIPEVDVSGENQIEIFIISNNKLKINETEITFRGDDLFVFNVLMYLREETSITINDMKLLGFRESTELSNRHIRTLFADALKRVREDINSASQTELIGSESLRGRLTHYPISPRLKLIDQRDSSMLLSDGLESVEEKKEGSRELYRGIVHEFNNPEEGAPEGELKIIVTKDNEILIDDKAVVLRKNRLFILNALITLRNEDPASIAHIIKQGFMSGAHSLPAFSNAMKQLRQLLTLSSGMDVIERLGKGKAVRYRINPNVMFIDRRSDRLEAPFAEKSKEHHNVVKSPTTSPRTTPKAPNISPAIIKNKRASRDLSETIIPLKPPDSTSIEGRENLVGAFILTDNTLKINDTSIRLEGDRLFAFNGLRLRGRPSTMHNLKKFGFRPGASLSDAALGEALGSALEDLMQEINKAAGVEVIARKSDGPSTFYSMHPHMLLYDTRHVADSDDFISKRLSELKSRNQKKKNENEKNERNESPQDIPIQGSLDYLTSQINTFELDISTDHSREKFRSLEGFFDVKNDDVLDLPEYSTALTVLSRGIRFKEKEGSKDRDEIYWIEGVLPGNKSAMIEVYMANRRAFLMIDGPPVKLKRREKPITLEKKLQEGQKPSDEDLTRKIRKVIGKPSQPRRVSDVKSSPKYGGRK